MDAIVHEASLGHMPPGLRLAGALAALGIVYGDIGTSPLYALKEAVKAASAEGAPTSEAVLGAVSVILWALILIVSLKYAILILRADNRGEGGIVAMLALLHAREAPPRSGRALLLIVGLIGAALLYGDGAITPAISVLSAIEGLKVDAPEVTRFVLPITVAVLVGLFAVQRRGTGFIGGVFGPVMLLWFAAIALLGIRGVIAGPGILAAINPAHAFGFMLHAGLRVSFAMLGAAFLAVTGGEAMYADLGHFGRVPIRLAWFAIALPCLVLNYFGQGGYLLENPSALDNPFYQLAPGWAHYPLVALAAAATVIASQAIISGAFSLTQQSIQLGFLPRMQVKHTASQEIGQIYIPFVNWLLAIATLGAVIAFRSSDALAGAYGIAVSALMAITTVLAALVALQWGYNPMIVLAVNGAFIVIDLVFFAANSIKLFEGGWFPLALAGLVAFLMLTWRRGQIVVERLRAEMRQPEEELVGELRATPPIRLPGTAAFLTGATTGVPLPITRFLRHNHALHERVLLVNVQTTETPRVAIEQRLEVLPVIGGINRVNLRYGFTERPDIPAGIRLAITRGKIEGVDPEAISYIIGRETIIPSERPSGMARWREIIFAFVQRNSERGATYFGVPARQVVQIGTEIEM
ncbi:MAG: KUP/HAK/KT family potassium transporter [Alphaproteobacteria bacterium]|nr:KUP/HAK/KT family potassium transporter [Alphaproteobacteria bacterium]